MAQREFENEIEPSDPRVYAQFKAHGDMVEGFLAKTETVVGKYGDQVVADFRGDDGVEQSVTLSADLSDKLGKGIKVGDYLRIEYVDDRPTPKGSMKIFKVQRAKNAGKMPEKKKVDAPAAAASSAPF